MKDAIAHADRYFSGEQWVLGDQGGRSLDRGKLRADLKARYNGDFDQGVDGLHQDRAWSCATPA